MPWGSVVLQTNFIMTTGPMVMTSSIFSPSSIRSSRAWVTMPLRP